jgi:hypothetical protein
MGPTQREAMCALLPDLPHPAQAADGADGERADTEAERPDAAREGRPGTA